MRHWAYAVRRRVLAVLRWPTRGVKVLAFDAGGRILLIRNTYGDTTAWVLPGGGVRWREAPAAAAVREVREETGCAITEIVAVATFESRGEGKRDSIHLFRALTADIPVAEPHEIAEARFFAPDALPGGASPATRRRIAEMMEGRTADSRW